MGTEKQLTLKVNVSGDKEIKKLKDDIENVEVKAQKVAISASDMADSYKNNLQEVLEYVVLQMSKIEALISELNIYAGQVIDKNVEAGEKLAQNMEESGESALSAISIKAVEASALVEAWVNKLANRTEEQSAKLAVQVETNKTLLDNSLEEINKKYNNKDIGILNLEAHKENVEAHIKELKKLKSELEAAILNTGVQYNAMSLHYDKDSEEFQKAQEDKAQALEKLQAKAIEVDKVIKDSNSSHLEVWEQQHKEIKTKLDEFYNGNEDKGKLKDFIDNNSYGFENFVTNFGQGIADLKTGFDTIATKEKEVLDKEYEKKIGKLDKELEKVNAEVTKYKEEKKQLEKEQEEANKKAEKYKADIAKIKEAYDIQSSDANAGSDKTTTESIESPSEGELQNKSVITPPSDEEMVAAQDRISALEKLATEEERIASEKQQQIADADKAIAESNRSVLLEQMRIADEKAKLEEEKEKKQAAIEAKAKKRKEQLEKLEKIKAKAQLVVDIATATKDIAKGVAAAWGKGPILGPPLAALVALQGAVQIGVMSQQLKYFADGGLLNGKRHSQGGMRIEGTNIEVEGGEYVVNRESTAKNIGLVRYINSQRRELSATDLTGFFAKASQGYEPPFRRQFEAGGQMPAIEPNASVDNEALIHAIRNIRIEPKVAVTDILRVQDEMTEVNGWAGN